MRIPSVPTNGKFRILVVEDDHSIARLVLANLAKAGLETLFAADGAAGLKRFQDEDPHLVITDIMMPHMNGQELCAKIRETSGVPIIMMTAADSEERQMTGFKLGADDYLAKPFNPKVLIARVLANLRRVYRYDISETQAPVAPAAVAEPVMDTARADWPTCNACGYMGPRDKFVTTDASGRMTLVCPVCKQSNVAFSIG